MKKTFGMFLTALFAVGMLICPTVHKAYCGAASPHHDSTTCTVCSLTHTSFMAAVPPAVLLPVGLTVRELSLPQFRVFPFDPAGSAQARAPPAT